jgi:peptidoglycan/xylan/chitin deacetylase (PgdA/CDA1 family)
MKNLIFSAGLLMLLSACNSGATTESKESDSSAQKNLTKDTVASQPQTMADAAAILARKQVPVLCYHHIRDVNDAGIKNIYEVTLAKFQDQMKALHDSGYTAILPDQLYDYLAYGKALPEKPVMITYDDTDEEQFSFAKPIMDKYGFKAVYFIMTIAMNKPRYMSKEQIRQLSDEGHVIASHTWDHSRTDRYKEVNEIEEGGRKKVVNDWDQQLVKTKNQLKEITGKEPVDFAFPFGIWKSAGLPEVQKRGYRMAFQLAEKRDSAMPLYTVRRIIVAPGWDGARMIRAMKSQF